MALMEFFAGFGVALPIHEAATMVLAEGTRLLVDESRGGDWVFDTDRERTVRVPKGRFVKVVRADGLEDLGPTDLESGDPPFLFAGRGRAAFLVSTGEGFRCPIFPALEDDG